MTALTGPCSRRPVWTFVELAGGLIHPGSLEMLGGGRRLADQCGVELGAVILGRPGRNLREAALEVMALGADTIYVTEDARLANYQAEACGVVLSCLMGKYRPRALLIGATAPGRHLAGRLHACGLAADCAVHTKSPAPGPLPLRLPDRAGHIVVEPMPLRQGDAGLSRPTLLTPQRRSAAGTLSRVAAPNH